MNLKLIHFEHALPPMADLGLEHLLPKVFRAFLTALGGLDKAQLAEVSAALASGDKVAAGEAMAVILQSLLASSLATIDAEDLAQVFNALASSGDTRAVRRLIAVARATDFRLLEWEDDPATEAQDVRAAALMSPEEVKAAISDFFGSLGLSLKPSPDSSEPGKPESARPVDLAISGLSEPSLSPS